MKVYFEDFIRFGIPINEYSLPKKKSKGLVFVVHKLNSSKDSGLGLIPKKLAEAGYLVVAIDSYKHGLRKEEPFIHGVEKLQLAAMVEVINQTVLDIKFLYDNHYSQFFSSLSVFGISMGGVVAFQMPRVMNNVDKIVSLQATPFLRQLYHDKELKHIYKGLTQQEQEVMDEYLDKLSLEDSLEGYKKVAIFAANRQDDMLIRPENSQKFIQHLKLLGNFRAEHVLYSGNHDIVEKMADDALLWIAGPNRKE